MSGDARLGDGRQSDSGGAGFVAREEARAQGSVKGPLQPRIRSLHAQRFPNGKSAHLSIDLCGLELDPGQGDKDVELDTPGRRCPELSSTLPNWVVRARHAPTS